MKTDAQASPAGQLFRTRQSGDRPAVDKAAGMSQYLA